ncbi:MAG: hypothetical protein R8G34_01125 [Paracoccaceae bacterium]|nr:hypothetical protein [Paracoccaceae bacterium]
MQMAQRASPTHFGYNPDVPKFAYELDADKAIAAANPDLSATMAMLAMAFVINRGIAQALKPMRNQAGFGISLSGRIPGSSRHCAFGLA